MNTELAELLSKDKENLESSWAIASALDAACDLLLEKFKLQCSEIAIDLKLEFDFGINWSKRCSGFYFWHKNWQNRSIGFEFQGKANELIFGLCWDPNIESDKSKAIEYFKKLNVDNIGKNSNHWPYYEYLEPPFDNWDKKEPWVGIIDGSLKELIKEKVSGILSLLEDN